jgi:4a-hydroxytetrahydrobiopterin dehydratase
MMGPITARQFHLSSGVGDWRVAEGGACAYFRTGSFATGAHFVQVVSELPGLDDHAPDVDLRPDGVFVRPFTTAPAPDGLSSRDVELARRISSTAQQLGLTAEPAEVQTSWSPSTRSTSKVLAFWRAVLGYGDRDGGPVEELNDRQRRKPGVGFQQMDAPRPQRNRIHLDVWVPHDQAEARVADAVAAGGRVVSDEMAPVVVDAGRSRGQRVDVATWIGTDGRGYP